MTPTTTIGQLVDEGALVMSDGYRTKRSEHGRPGFRIIRVADVEDGRVNANGPDFVSDAYRVQIGSKAGEPGDILLTTKGTVGRVAVFEGGDSDVVYSPQLCFFRVVNESIVSRGFLRYWFSSPAFVQQASDRKGNTDMADYINLADIRSLNLRLPPLHEQRAIAEVLGALDDKIAANTKLATVLSNLAQTEFDRSTEGLATMPLADATLAVLGGTPSRENSAYWGGDVPWASAKDVVGASFGALLETSETISDLATEQTKARPLPTGSVILTARGTVGAVARLLEPASFNQSCYGFVPGSLPPSVLYYSVLRAADHAKSMAHGSVFDTITMRTFTHLQVPRIEGTKRGLIERRLEPILDRIGSAVRESRTLAALRDTLLPQLMSGKLRVKDAEKLVDGAV